jgi:peptidoglycan/xylan/chitin deacetylase (PgdA/CDA1 family)
MPMRARFRALVLCYHAISDSWLHSLAVGPLTLTRQVSWLLGRGYRPVTAADVLSGDSRLLHVTFDDAYRSVATALPTLERLGVQSTVFACPAYADEGRPLDVVELAAEAAAQPDELATMDWPELRRLAKQGVEIGSHTLLHSKLTRLSDRELDRELRESRARIEAELGKPCRFLAYPYGEEDARVRLAARDAGYEAAFTLPGRQMPPDPFAVPRIGVYRRDARLRFAVKSSEHVRRLALPLVELTRAHRAR